MLDFNNNSDTQGGKQANDVAKTVVGGFGIVTGSGSCSLLGAAIGFLVGPGGALLGALPGALLGGVVGGVVGGKVGEFIDQKNTKKDISEQYEWLEPGEELIIEETIKK